MGYCDYTDAWLRDLTRQRRREAAASRARPQPVRFTVLASIEWSPPTCEIEGVVTSRRRKRQARAWKLNMWGLGVRHCCYCRVEMTLRLERPNTATVEHRHPLALGGADDATNWAISCLACNNAKGELTEGEFLSLRAARGDPCDIVVREFRV